MSEAWQCPRCGQVNAPWVPCCSCRPMGDSSGVKVPGEPGLAGSEGLPEGRGSKAPDSEVFGKDAYVEANTVQQDANTRLPVEELTDCPGCQARISYWRNREDEEAKEREVAEAIAKQGLGCGELPPPPAWRGLRQEVEASRLAWEVAWEAAESPPSGGEDPGEDDAQTYFDLGALQKRGEVVEVSPATGCASCGEDHVPADDPYAGEACKVDGKRYHRRPVGLGVERGEAATVRGVDGKRYPWKEWEAAGRPPGEKPHPSGCCCDVCHRVPKREGRLLGGEVNERPLSHTPTDCPCGRDHSRVGDRVFIDAEGRLRFPDYRLCSRCGAWTNLRGEHDCSLKAYSQEERERYEREYKAHAALIGKAIAKYSLRPHPPFYHIAGGGCPCGEV